MKNAGFLNLPSWKDHLQDIFVKYGRNDILKLPLLGRENSDNIWSAFDHDDFFAITQTGIYFSGRPVNCFTEKVITNNDSFAIERLKSGNFKDTYYSAALGGLFPFIKMLSEGTVEKVRKFYVLNDAFTGFVLSSMEKENKTFEEAVCDAKWKGLSDDNSNYNLHGIVSRNRLVLQIADIFGCFVEPQKIFSRGINNLSKTDIDIAKNMDMSIRLLGIACYDGNTLKVASEPCIIPEKYFLAQARGSSEIIYVKTDDDQSHVYACPGYSHLTVVKGIINDLDYPSKKSDNLIKVDEISDFENKFYLRFNLVNLTGTLSSLLKIFTQCGIDIEKIIHPEVSCETSEGIPLVVITGNTTRNQLNTVLANITENLKLATFKADFRIIDRG